MWISKFTLLYSPFSYFLILKKYCYSAFLLLFFVSYLFLWLPCSLSLLLCFILYWNQKRVFVLFQMLPHNYQFDFHTNTSIQQLINSPLTNPIIFEALSLANSYFSETSEFRNTWAKINKLLSNYCSSQNIINEICFNHPKTMGIIEAF